VCFFDDEPEESAGFKIFLNPNELSYGLKTLDPNIRLIFAAILPDTLIETVSHQPFTSLASALPTLVVHAVTPRRAWVPTLNSFRST
jgi:hypothetical protein